MTQRELRVRLAFQMLEDRHLLSAVAFVERGRINLDHIVNSIESADFDNDGLTEILASGWADLIGPGGMSVHRGWSGDAPLEPLVLTGLDDEGIPPQGEVLSWATDVDGDGFEDVVALSYDSIRLHWFQNDRQRGFLDPVQISDKRTATAVTADIDGDGDSDLVIISWSGAYWFENTNGHQFDRRSALVGASGSRGIRPADMDQDGDLVLAFQAGHYSAAATPRASHIAAAVDLAFARDTVVSKNSKGTT